MGVTFPDSYTARMASTDTLLFESGDLRIYPELGEIANIRGESARLGPVNAKVLLLLASRQGQVVTRAELLDGVWRNQVVSDDALTRCISDIRAELGRLSKNKFIETLPKRGYRWMVTVRESSAARESPTAGPEPAPVPAPRALLATTAAWLGRSVSYLTALILIASLGVWLIDRMLSPGPPIVALLPTRADAAERELAASIERQLSDYLLGLDQVAVLSRTAVESRPANPFPYFHYEFGARWLVESDLRKLAGTTVWTVVLVDARVGTVVFRTTSPVPHEAEASVGSIAPALRELAEYIDAEIRN